MAKKVFAPGVLGIPGVDDLEPGWERRRSDANIWMPEGDSMTEQSHVKSCDINFIMAKYEKSGLIDHVRDGGEYGDFSEARDYHSACNAVMAAEEAFMTLDARVRKKFDNDPGQFLAFMDDPKNEDEIYALGLAARPAPPVTAPPAPPKEPKE